MSVRLFESTRTGYNEGKRLALSLHLYVLRTYFSMINCYLQSPIFGFLMTAVAYNVCFWPDEHEYDPKLLIIVTMIYFEVNF